MSLDELTEKITKWGNDKGILDSDRNLFYIKNWNDPPAVWSLVNGKKRLSYAEKAYAQLQKTKEEVRELEEELEMLLSTSNSNKINGAVVKNNIMDAIGDIYVTLVMQAGVWGLEMEECVEYAYTQIKDRKGKMVDGIFVKEEEEQKKTEQMELPLL